MAIRTIYVCDGCDAETENPKFDGWRTIGITIDKGFGPDMAGDCEWELCPSCQSRVRDALRPKNWPRPGPKVDGE